MISKLMRLYKRSHGLRQICNIAVYIAHSACTLHLLNLPDKNARRDIVHGVKHLEEIAEGWLCARRTLCILSVLARKWDVDMPEEAAAVLARTDVKFSSYVGDISSPPMQQPSSPPLMNPSQFATQAAWQTPAAMPTSAGYLNNTIVSSAGAGVAKAGAPVRKNSGNDALPPQNADGLRAQQYPSATTTPNSARGDSHNMQFAGGRTAASPSDMFGGVDQLIRDSQNWVYRDQAQFATGFENWNALDIDPSTWVNSGLNGAPVPVTNAMSMPASGAPYATIGASANDGFPPTSWLNGANPYGMAPYNEREWYQ